METISIEKDGDMLTWRTVEAVALIIEREEIIQDWLTEQCKNLWESYRLPEADYEQWKEASEGLQQILDDTQEWFNAQPESSREELLNRLESSVYGGYRFEIVPLGWNHTTGWLVTNEGLVHHD